MKDHLVALIAALVLGVSMPTFADPDDPRGGDEDCDDCYKPVIQEMLVADPDDDAPCDDCYKTEAPELLVAEPEADEDDDDYRPSVNTNPNLG